MYASDYVAIYCGENCFHFFFANLVLFCPPFLLLKVLNFDSPRGGISLETEKTRTGTSSKLLVTRAAASDNGNYTCLPSRGEAVSATVHVIKG